MKTTAQLKAELNVIRTKLKNMITSSPERDTTLSELDRLIALLYIHEDYYRTKEEIDFLRTIIDGTSQIDLTVSEDVYDKIRIRLASHISNLENLTHILNLPVDQQEGLLFKPIHIPV